MSQYQVERGVEVKKSQLKPNPWNPNKTSSRQQAAINESLQTYGQILDLIVRPHPEGGGCYEIIDGEHRYDELEDRLYVNIIHGLSDADAKKLTIILNESHGSADKIELAQLLSELQGEFGSDELVVGLPYAGDELTELIKLADIDWEPAIDLGTEDNEKGAEETEDEWMTLLLKVPSDAFEVIQDARNLIDQEREGLHDDKAIAWGQVMEALAADYLALPH